MKFVYKDLLTFLSEKPSIEDISDKLFQLGHEHEVDGDIFDIDFTPNRGDCLSLLGLARDLKVFFGNEKPLEIYNDNINELDIEFINSSPSNCPKITFLEIEIEGIIKKYKSYLENYFNILGNNKTNFFTDISNYISYEQGQPTHCYDREHIKNKLIFDNKFCNDSFSTLLGSTITLQGENCVFINDNNVISLAGVMGGKTSACSTETTKVLVECAYFNPEAIIGKSVKYNLNSDAAYRFERGVDISSHDVVLRRFIKIVQDHSSIKDMKIKTFSEKSFQNLKIPFDIKAINSILGIDIDKGEYLDYLTNLGFVIENNFIVVPSYRHDISSQNDLAEEIARVKGYDSIESKKINLKKNIKIQDDRPSLITNFLIKNGFTEVINFPFTSLSNENSIKIDNPLDSKRKYLRTSLKDSLLENLLYNERRQKDSIKLFEISDVYLKNDLVSQKQKLGVIISGRRGRNHVDFSKSLDNKYLDTLLNGKLNNKFFAIDEIKRDSLKTKRNEKIFYVEALIENIPTVFFQDIESEIKPINFIKYCPVSEFPASTRDFSFSISDPNKYSEVIKLLQDFNHEYLKDSFIFDFYINYKKEEIKVGVRLIFQSTIKTLSDLEIQNAVEEILDPIINFKDVTIPGLKLK